MRHLLLLLCLAAAPARADIPSIEGVALEPRGTDWRATVTLRHPDTGEAHHADAWAVETADGTRLGLRELTHPHVEEQPFARSLGNVTIPGTADSVFIRAHCTIDGWSAPLEVPVPGR